jgi:hypothetical protein
MTGKYCHRAQPELYVTQFLLSVIMNYLYECSRDFAVCIYTFWNNHHYPRNTKTTGI